VAVFFNQGLDHPARGKVSAKLFAALLGAVVALAGCAAEPVAPPKVPVKKQAQKDTEQREPAPLRHLAPPPAYGNKVVMAEAEPPDTQL
jgi:hypothetical protein